MESPTPCDSPIEFYGLDHPPSNGETCSSAGCRLGSKRPLATFPLLCPLSYSTTTAGIIGLTKLVTGGETVLDLQQVPCPCLVRGSTRRCNAAVGDGGGSGGAAGPASWLHHCRWLHARFPEDIFIHDLCGTRCCALPTRRVTMKAAARPRPVPGLPIISWTNGGLTTAQQGQWQPRAGCRGDHCAGAQPYPWAALGQPSRCGKEK
jgi:hypothetical protein